MIFPGKLAVFILALFPLIAWGLDWCSFETAVLVELVAVVFALLYAIESFQRSVVAYFVDKESEKHESHHQK